MMWKPSEAFRVGFHNGFYSPFILLGLIKRREFCYLSLREKKPTDEKKEG